MNNVKEATTAALESARESMSKLASQYNIEQSDAIAYGFYETADSRSVSVKNLHEEYLEVVKELDVRKERSFEEEAAEYLASNGREATDKIRKAAWKNYYNLSTKGYKFPIAVKEAKRKALAYQNVLK